MSSRAVVVILAQFAITFSVHARLVFADSDVRTVALSGQQATDAPDGVNYWFRFFSFDQLPRINNRGQVAFANELIGLGTDGDRAIWSEGGGNGLRLAARAGDLLPGATDGASLFNLRDFALSESGETVFTATLFGEGVEQTNDLAILREDEASGLSLVVRRGDPAVNENGAVPYSFVQGTSINAAGQVTFDAFLSGLSADNKGIYLATPSAGTERIARTGEQAAGVESGTTFRTLSAPPKLNEAGQVAFKASLVGPNVFGNVNSDGLWREDNGSGLTLIARQGDQAPGTPAGIRFQKFSNLQLSNDGTTLVHSTLMGVGINSTNDEGIWSGEDGELALVARLGDQAEDAPADVTYATFDELTISQTGQTAFQGQLAGPGVDASNDRGVWIERENAGLTLLVRSGDRAPGTPDGVNYRVSNLTSPVLNALGQTAFAAGLVGPGIDRTNDWGIWIESPEGILTLIARTGDQFDVNDDPLVDDLRTIETISFREEGFNNLGELAFLARFTDGTSGIFVSSIVAIPEPASALLIGIAFFAWGDGRSSRST